MNTHLTLPRVSIPHRYAENLFYKFRHIESGIVSIPHRYAENAEEIIENGGLIDVFQFLIGTLKTPEWKRS